MAEIFDNDIVLIERLAQGGMGEVYRAVQVGIGGFEKEVAVKRVLPNMSEQEEFKEMFIRETNITAALQHPNIGQVFRNGTFNGYLYLVMEFIHGKNIDQLIEKSLETKLSIPIEICCYIIAEAAKGLHHAHTYRDPFTLQPFNIIHRDISPPNIMVSFRGDVKVVDFGIAKGAHSQRLTKSGILKGKEAYMSPEQVEGKELDSRSDVFALGIVLYELLSRTLLFDAGTTYGTLTNVRACNIPPIKKFNDKVDDKLEAILLKSLAKNLDQRYQSAEQFYRDITVYLNNNFPSFVPTDLVSYLTYEFKTQIERDSMKRQWQATEISGVKEQAIANLANRKSGASGSLNSSSAKRTVVNNDGTNFQGTRVINGSQTRFPSTKDELVDSGGFTFNQKLWIASLLFIWLAVGGAFFSLRGGAKQDNNKKLTVQATTTKLENENLSSKSVESKDPSQVSGLVAWFSGTNITPQGDNKKLCSFSNYVGSKIQLNQNISNNCPELSTAAINGFQAVSFNGKNQYFESSTILDVVNSSEEFSAIIVARPKEIKSGYLMAIQGLDRDGDIFRFGFTDSGSLRAKADKTIGSYLDSPPTSYLGWGIYSVNISKSSVRIYQNNSIKITSGLTEPIKFNQARYFSVAQEWDPTGSSDFFDGEVADIIIFSRNLATEERVGIEKFLATKYKLTIY